MIKRYPAYGAVVGVAALSMVLAACSASSPTSTGASTTSGTSSPPAGSTASVSASGKHYTIAYELGYVANDWQKEAENLTLATSKVAPYSSRVTLQTHISGQSVEAQISQVQQEVAAGVDAIILYPLSPTALAPAVKQACAKKIPVFTYDAFVNASCAYQISIPYPPGTPGGSWGSVTAQWLATYLKGKGTIAMMTGVPGVSQDTWNVDSAKAVFQKYSGIHTIQEVTDWNQAISKTKMAEALASNSSIAGIWAENGCYGAEEGVLQAHLALIPCAGNSSNGHRQMMLPKSQGGMGLPSISIGTGVHEGALALIDAVKVLSGQTLPHHITNPLGPLTVTNATLNLGTNVFQNSKVGGPGFMDDFHNSQVPAAADTVAATLTGKP